MGTRREGQPKRQRERGARAGAATTFGVQWCSRTAIDAGAALRSTAIDAGAEQRTQNATTESTPPQATGRATPPRCQRKHITTVVINNSRYTANLDEADGTGYNGDDGPSRAAHQRVRTTSWKPCRRTSALEGPEPPGRTMQGQLSVRCNPRPTRPPPPGTRDPASANRILCPSARLPTYPRPATVPQD